MVYSIIMAGGIGSRFWPRSREAFPKQFLNVFDDASLLHHTLRRMKGLIPPERTFVITHERYEELSYAQLPELPAKHVLTEPISRNTAPCIAYAAVRLLKEDPDALMVVLPADHLIRSVPQFHDVLRVAIEAAREPGALITIGIKPTHPDTGYGYIQFDGHTEGELRSYPVRTFAEKPNVATAERFLDSGDFLWNSGIFIWRADTILHQLRKHLPKVFAAFKNLGDAIGSKGEADAVQRAYRKSPRISIDYGVMEQADKVFVVPGSFGWSDIGDWRAVYDLSEKDAHGNVLQNTVIMHDSSRCFVRADSRLVVLVGIHDAVVVDTEDAVLICHRESTQQVRNVVEYMHAHQLEEYV